MCLRGDLTARNGGEGGIRTPVPVTRQDAFEAPPLRPLRYLSVLNTLAVAATRRLPSGARLGLARLTARSGACHCAVAATRRLPSGARLGLARLTARSGACHCAVALRGGSFQPSL